ncbi:hypothetical protein ENBRE01_3404 [Enteropsectra breve]|nr:hypothetical protein ENBRE01_3404 [Enteropsectra breve]
MSVKNTIYVIKASGRLLKPLNEDYMYQILFWLWKTPSIGDDNLIFFSSYLQDFIAKLKNEKYKELEDWFVRRYSENTASIFILCMCSQENNNKDLRIYADKLAKSRGEGSYLNELIKLQHKLTFDKREKIDHWND